MIPFAVFMVIVMWIAPIILGSVWYFRTKSETGPQSVPRKITPVKYRSFIINSAVLYALAYNIIFFLQELFLVIPKAVLGLQPTLYHNNHNWLIEHPMQDLLQGSGSLSIFITGLLFAIILVKIKNWGGSFKLFVIWMTYQGLTQSIAQLSDVVMNPNGDTGLALRYLGVTGAFGVVLAAAGFVAIVIIGLTLTRPLLELAPDSAVVESSSGRINYLLQFGLGSSLIGFFLIVPFRIPPLSQVQGTFLISLFPMLWIVANTSRIKNVQVVDNRMYQHLSLRLIIALLLLLLFFRFVLAPGIQFY